MIDCISALEYIPQRPPFVMVDDILYCDLELCKTEFHIREDNLLVCNGTFLEAGLMENMAQSCAARIGYVCVCIKHEPIRVGVIGAVKNFHIFRRPRVGEVLQTEVVPVSEFFDMMVLDVWVRCNDELIADAELKVALMD